MSHCCKSVSASRVVAGAAAQALSMEQPEQNKPPVGISESSGYVARRMAWADCLAGRLVGERGMVFDSSLGDAEKGCY